MNATMLRLKPSLIRWELCADETLAGEIDVWHRIPDDLRVIESIDYRNDEPWLHVSLSYANRLPSWEDIRDVKETFCGKDREAYIVLPPEKRYVNDHPYCLHLWCPIDGPVLPDFRRKAPDGRWTL